MDIEHPVTYSEKIQWLKLYDPNTNRSMLADKIAVRDWIKTKIGEEYLIPIYGTYDSFDEIDFDKLPDQFVIKTNHSSGWNIVVKDKSTFDRKSAKKKIKNGFPETMRSGRSMSLTTAVLSLVFLLRSIWKIQQEA